MMKKEDEKLELARTINRTQYLLHHSYMRRLLSENVPDLFPSLTPQQIHMIMTVREHGQVTLKKLAQALHVTAPSASCMLDRLVERCFLTRDENPTDRREVIVRVSPSQESQLQAIERRNLQFALDLFDKVGIECAREWASVCARLQQYLTPDKNETATEVGMNK